jgi:polar amino acid transport system substrate-binding protein
MTMSLRIFVMLVGLLGIAGAADAQQASDPRIADLVAAGKVRFGTFPPQYTKDAATGELKGPWVEVMRALGAHMGLSVMLIELATPSKLVECLDTGPCDVGSLGFDPTRAGQVGGFTAPFMQVEYTYLVPAGSAIHSVADVDRPGVRIAVVRNHASTLALGRTVKQAEQVSADTPDAAFDLLRNGRADAWASVRPALLDYSAKLSGSRVLEDSYGANFPALVVPKGKAVRLAYISEFVEEAKASGVVQRAIDRAGQPGYRMAALAKPSIADDRSKVAGLWKLVSYEVEIQATGQKEPVMGQNPTGYASFLPEGRVFFILTGEARKPAKTDQERADLLGTLVAYTGTYRIEGDKWITKVEVAWNPEWVGTEQARILLH